MHRLEKAERIIKLAELTRKFETEREKVLPFYESSVEEEAKEGRDAFLEKRPRDFSRFPKFP